MKKLLELRKYLALLPQVEPIFHDAAQIVEDVQDGKLDDAATASAALDLGKRLLSIVGWVKAHSGSAS